MPEKKFYWKNTQIREHIDVISNKLAPTTLLKNTCYLNPYLRKWVKAHIWIYCDRIVYVGDKLPEHTENMELIDCEGQTVVPGYIEPHAHPFQLYNPLSLAKYVSQYGTTTLICDNLFLLLQSIKKKALSYISDLNQLPFHFYWWARYDLQTEVHSEEEFLSHSSMKKWLDHDSVLQGGELTGWPKLLDGDDLILHWMQETKRKGKRIEGHFPGASETTLSKMKLFGTDCDHESMTGQDVVNRLMLGYTVSLRHSSIRPDLPRLLQELHELGVNTYDHLFFTTDGSTPTFYENGMMNICIEIALDNGVPAIDAYNMATFNSAKYYHLDDKIGVIAPGRIASLNILKSKENPNPISVMAKGVWVKKDGKDKQIYNHPSWSEDHFGPLSLNWDLSIDDLQFSMPLGMKMRNAVIMEPYSITIDNSVDELSENHDESFLALIDKNGKWRLNTMIKGFAKHVQGLVSSYSTTGDIIVIGKKKSDMLHAFHRMKEIGGGIVLAEDGKILHEIPLQLNGGASIESLEIIMKQEQQLDAYLKERGYHFTDPIYSLLFMSSTHLPYIRITPRGIYDVMNKMVLFPSIMR